MAGGTICHQPVRCKTCTRMVVVNDRHNHCELYGRPVLAEDAACSGYSGVVPLWLLTASLGKRNTNEGE